MRKLFTVLLALALVVGMSSFVMAEGNNNGEPAEIFGNASLNVGITVHPYGEFGIVTDLYQNRYDGDGNAILAGLFNDMEIGAPGLYVSDGSATESVARPLFGAPEAVNVFNNDSVEMLVVAANVDTILTMEADFAGWDPDFVQLMFRFSSNDDIRDRFDGSIVIPTFDPATETLYSPFANEPHYNTTRWSGLLYENNNELIARGNISFNTINYLADLENWMGIAGSSWGDSWEYVSNLPDGQTSADIVVPFNQCTPTHIHVNGALYLEKATALRAADYSVPLTFTLAADM